MEDLTPPKETIPDVLAPRPLTMDEYIDFCDYHREHGFDPELNLRWKLLSVVTEKFRL